MKNVTLEELLEAGCHFGHQVTRQNPKARDYIFEARDNINIIDLEKTKEGLDEAQSFVKKLASEGKTMIILGTKRQAASIVKDEIARSKKEDVDGLFSVTNRWIGGILTNSGEVSKNYKRMKELSDILADKKESAKYTKKELLLFERERAKHESFYGGIADLSNLPDALFVIDTHLENIAVREAIAMDIPVVGITDTNADPTIIKYAIPANDDAVGSIQLITAAIVDAWIDGRSAKQNSDKKAAEKEAKEKEKAEKAKDAKESGEKKEEVKNPTSAKASADRQKAKVKTTTQKSPPKADPPLAEKEKKDTSEVANSK